MTEVTMVPSWWCWVLTLVCVFHFQEGASVLSAMYNIGIMKVGYVWDYPSWSSRWCDGIMLCGRNPITLHIVTIETTLNESFKVTERQPDINLWILKTSADIDLRPLKDHLRAHYRQFLDYSQQSMPETDVEWCSLILRFAFTDSRDGANSGSVFSMQHVMAVVEKAELKTVVVVYNNDTGMEVTRLSEGLSRRGILHVLYNTDSVGQSDRVSVVDKYWALQSRVVDFEEYTDVLLWCNVYCISTFLTEMTQDVNAETDDIGIQHMTRFFIVYTSVQSASSCVFDNQSGLIVPHDQSARNVSLNQKGCLTERHGDIMTVVQQFFHVAVLWTTRNCVHLQTLLMTSNGNRTFSSIGFSQGDKAMALASDIFPNTKWRLNGQKFIVATAIWEPFVMVRNDGGRLVYSGLCIDMLKALANSLNFTYDLRMPADGQYGSIENGSWTGLVRMLKDKDAQLVVAPIAVNELRATVVDFSTPFYQDYTGVLFKRPDPSLHKWKTYFMPFSWQVYVLIALCFLAGTVLGHALGVFLPSVFQKKKPEINVMDTVQYFFGSLLAQGGVWQPTTGSARMFVSAWWVFSVVMAAIYSGNLTASFAVSNYDPSFTTLDQMLAQNAYEFGTVPGTIWIDIFKYSNRSDFKRIDEMIVKFTSKHAYETIDETGDHVRLASEGGYAYVGNMASLSLTLAHHCDLMILKETFLPLQYAIALQKGSPLTDTVSQWIMMMNEGGLDDLWASHWWRTPDQKCGVQKKTEVKVIQLEDCQSAFYVLLLGIGLALFAVLSERGFYWFLHRNGKNVAAKNGGSGHRQDHQTHAGPEFGSLEDESRPRNGVHQNGVSCITEYKSWFFGGGLSLSSYLNRLHRTLNSQEFQGREH